MNDIKSIEFSNIDADILYQGGFVKTEDADLKDIIIRDYLYQLEKEIKPLKEREMGVESGAIPFKGTSRSLEDLLKANRIAYTLLERTIIIEDIKIPQIIFTTLSFGSLISGIITLLIYYIKDVYLFNPFISIIIIIGSIGWLATAIAVFRIRRK